MDNRAVLATTALCLILCGPILARGNLPLKVVTTLPDYAYFACRVGGERVSVFSIVEGNQDAHFIRPKPSFVTRVAKANLVVATGLDLELWLPTVINKAGNTHVRSGQPGFVSAAKGMNMLEVPKLVSRVEGGLHLYGNPHVTCSPVNMRIAARNIAHGLIKNDPEGREFYLENLENVQRELDDRLFGKRLVEMLGGDVLSKLAEQGKLWSFLEKRRYEGKPLVDYLGGWLGKMAPLRGTAIVTYHKNWVYFLSLFGLVEAGTVEPKPGIPPSPRHRLRLLQSMQSRKVRILLSANYFNESLATSVARRAGARSVFVPLYVKGAPGIDDYFDLVDHWVSALIDASNCLPSES